MKTFFSKIIYFYLFHYLYFLLYQKMDYSRSHTSKIIMWPKLIMKKKNQNGKT